MILLYRAPLLLGMLLLQVTPTTATPPTSFTDLLLQALPQVPIYVILAYIVINMQRDNTKSNERRDAQEERLIKALVVERERIDVIEDDRRIKERERDDLHKLFAQNVKDNSDLVKALGVRTEFLIDSDKAEGDTLKSVADKVDTMYDRFMKVFPKDTSVIELFGELKNVLEETKKVCAEKKHKTGEIPLMPSLAFPQETAITLPQEIDVTLHTADPTPAPDGAGVDGGSEVAA